MLNLQAIDILFEISADNGVTWLALVCLADQTVPVTVATTETNTACGIAVGLGPAKVAPTFNAVADIQPLSGTLGYKECLGYSVNRTRLKYRQQSPGSGSSIGINHYISTFGYFTAVTLTETVGDVLKFSGTFNGEGTPSLTPGS